MPPKAGSSTQHNQQRNAAKTDKEPVKEKLEAVHGAHKNLEKALSQSGLQEPEFGKPEFDEKKLTVELKKMEQVLGKHEEERKKEAEEVKNIVYRRLRDKVFRERDGYVKETVGDEISRQVKAQVETQISCFLPVSLEDQLTDANKYLEKMKKALENSEARLVNSGINATDRSDWSRPLKEIFKDDGTKSKLYPIDLTSLFLYEEDNMRALMADFKLNTDTSMNPKVENFNRFIQYIGVRGRFGGVVVE